MKRIFYIALMMIFFVLISFGVYLSAIFSVVYYHIISINQVLAFTDLTMSLEAYSLVGIIGITIGYFFGKKWWKIIYIDKVYHFGKGKNQ